MAGESPPDPTFDPKEEKQMMEFLTQQIHLLEEKARLQATVREEKKLLVENSKLKKDIDDLKRKLQETQRKKSMKLHQERVLTASVSAMKAAILEVPAAPETTSTSKPQRSNTHKHSEGRRRRERRGVRVGGASKGTSEAVCGLERDLRPDVSRLDLRIGRVQAVRKHPDSESLYVQEVDVGDSAPRSVVSELANHVSLEQLQDTLAILLCNIRPVKVRGIQSQARVLCAVSQHRMEPLAPPTGAQPGDRVTFQNFPGEAERELNPKLRIWERLLPDLQVDERGVATYRGVAFEVRGKGLCRAPTISNGGIK